MPGYNTYGFQMCIRDRNNKLQNHISNYAQSLKEKSKELEKWCKEEYGHTVDKSPIAKAMFYMYLSLIHIRCV